MDHEGRLLQNMRARLITEISRNEEDLQFWEEMQPNVRFDAAYDGGPLENVTEERLDALRARIAADKALLIQVEEAIAEPQ